MSHFAVTIALVSGGYPGEYQTGKVIHGLDHTRRGNRISCRNQQDTKKTF